MIHIVAGGRAKHLVVYMNQSQDARVPPSEQCRREHGADGPIHQLEHSANGLPDDDSHACYAATILPALPGR
jgi:hypothetical protein